MSAALLDAVRLHLAEHGGEPTPARVATALRAQGRLLGDSEVLGVVAALRSELVGAGPLEPLLADPDVTDILVNAPDQVWIDRGRGLERSGIRFADTAAVRRLAQRLATTAGRRLDDARPWVDARLPDGTRLHAVLPPVVVGSPCLSLRVVRARAFTLAELVAAGTLDTETAALLRAVLDARLSFMISGGTGSGACSDSSTRRPASSSPRTPRSCAPTIRTSSGWRPGPPTRRAPDTSPCAISSGRPCGCGPTGSWSAKCVAPRYWTCWARSTRATRAAAVHANAASDVPARLEALGSTAGLDRAALHSQLAAALSVVVHLVRDGSGRRRVAEIHVLRRAADGLVGTVPALVRDARGHLDRGPGWQRLTALCTAGAS
jgi:pilus assembly protein CpaF